MKRLLLGMTAGILFGFAASGLAREPRQYAGAERPIEGLNELTIDAGSGNLFAVPSNYGRLAAVAVSSDVHYLYFEDGAGAIRVVLVGPRGAVQRSRHEFELLTPDVYLLKRESRSPAPVTAP